MAPSRMDKPFERPTEMLQRTLHVSGALAERLVAGGITTLEEVAYVPLHELRQVGGLWEEEATVLRNSARKYVLDQVIGGEGDLGGAK